ncbi:transcriptional regulator [Halobacteroides halobius DSM 5150]|uniref:Transcriptional regulator n=1 Tax=Halobacteroides halobius (strain ATCC 35273 / DSM 5150 / MD-1) TaxID=748449 RepID=L0K8M0_HALHC|nr:GntR family transcriptional regulator [Halobacteroides halobius]AGB40709.1 transcriptional regulator [Halobacteroides halobius DSM 5150]
MSLIRKDSRPLYILVKEKLDEQIENGTYQSGDRLPSEAKLAEKFGVSRATLREALRVLEKEGIINRKQGVGTFIADKAALFRSGIEELASITETIEAMDLEAGTIELAVKSNQRFPDLAKEFEIDAQSKMVSLQRTRTANGEPVAYCRDFLPQKFLNEEVTDDNFDASLFDYLQEECNLYITYAVADVLAVTADRLLAEKLNVELGSPLLLLKQMHYDDRDTPILYSENYFRNDKFEFHVLRNRS